MNRRRLIMVGSLVALGLAIAGFVIAASGAKRRAESMGCANMVASVAFVTRFWAEENGGVCPTDFVRMSNDLVNPKTLICPGDHKRQEAADWSSFTPEQCSYEILAPGLAVQDTNTAFLRCKVHGHLGYTDGTVFDGVRRRHKHEGSAPDMSTPPPPGLLWWVIPQVLAGMPMPFIHPDRRLAGGGALTAFEDELPALHAAGVRAVVCLLNIPSDALIYESAGFAFHCSPIPDGAAPTLEQADAFVAFVTRQRAVGHPVAVHCEAGLGRTGTLIATYLISQGANAEAAIRRVRSSERTAIETPSQIQFLEQYARRVRPVTG